MFDKTGSDSLEVPSDCIGTCNSIALTYRFMKFGKIGSDPLEVPSDSKGMQFYPKNLYNVSALVIVLCSPIDL